MSAQVVVAWSDRSGHVRHVTAKCRDCSESGMSVELPEALEVRSHVLLRMEQGKLTGGATVRHCRRLGAKYLVGLEFGNGMSWRPKSTDVETMVT